MIQTIKNKAAQFEAKWSDTLWYKTGKISYRIMFLLICYGLMIIGAFLWFFFGGDENDNSDSGKDFKGSTDQDDRNADDIWKLSSGNDYYDRDPPDRFS